MDKYLIALSEINGLGQVTLKKLIDLFGSAQNIWQAKAADLKNFQLPEKIIKIIINERLKLNPDKIVEQIIKEQETIIGPIALERAQKVTGLKLNIETLEISLNGDKKHKDKDRQEKCTKKAGPQAEDRNR